MKLFFVACFILLHSSGCLAPILHHKITFRGWSSGKRGGRVWEGPHFFLKQQWIPLPPQTHPSPLPHFILPYKLTHSFSHPLQGQPNGLNKMHMKCRGLMGTPRVGEIYLPILHPSDMCSAKKINNAQKMSLHRNCTAKLIGKNTAVSQDTSGNIGSCFLPD